MPDWKNWVDKIQARRLWALRMLARQAVRVQFYDAYYPNRDTTSDALRITGKISQKAVVIAGCSGINCGE
jgi:hypothetical protein